MKIALVHDDFTQAGGAESLFATIAALFPKAPIYTSLVDCNKVPKTIKRDRIRTSFIQKIPFSKKLYKVLLPLYPFAFETFDFSGFDVVLSSTTRFAKAIITKPQTMHICYINSAPRFLWDENVKKQYIPKTLKIIALPILSWLKRWDKVASSRVDLYVSNSNNVKGRVKKYYNRESEVIWPFADINFFDIPQVHNWSLKSKDYYLVVSRLVKWKKIGIAIVAAKLAGKKLLIVGTGPDQKRLEKVAREKDADVEFVGKVTIEQLKDYYQNANALIVTQEEDFGIASVEAQACGIPVIAYDSGGQQEIIINGKTGLFFKNQKAKELKDAIIASSEVKWSKSACRNNSLKFAQANFEKNLTKFIEISYGKFNLASSKKKNINVS